jgi:hypothetical protein
MAVEDGTNKMSRNVGDYKTTLLTLQKIENLIYALTEA